MKKHFIIHCLDKADALPFRLRYYEAHKAYLETAAVTLLVSGPLLADDGETMIGSFFLVEASHKSEVEDFSAADPFRKAGVWQDIRIHLFNKRVDRREPL